MDLGVGAVILSGALGRRVSPRAALAASTMAAAACVGEDKAAPTPETLRQVNAERGGAPPTVGLDEMAAASALTAGAAVGVAGLDAEDAGARCSTLTPARLRRHDASGGTDVSRPPFYLLVRTMMRHAPLLAMGLGRIVLVRAASYHEAADEYGVHWNFFFTLALVSAAAALLAPSSPRASAAAAAALVALHELAYSSGLAEWTLQAPRLGLLSANKEGLC